MGKSRTLPMLLLAVAVAAAQPALGGSPRLVRVHGTRAVAAAAALEQRGARLVRVLGSDRLLLLDGEQKRELRGDVSPWTATDATSPTLARLTAVEARRFPGGVPVLLGLAPGTDLAAASALLEAAGAVPAWVDPSRPLPELAVRVPADALEEVRATLAELPLVWADVQPPVRLRNAESTWRCQSGTVGQTPLFAHGILGEGQVIGLMDTGIDADMCFFYDPLRGLPPTNDDQGLEVDLGQRKVLAVDFYWDPDWPAPGADAWDSQGHGTHVAATIAGDDGDTGVHDGSDGMAPAARLVVQDGGYGVDVCADLPGLGCPVRSLEPVLEQAYLQGARIHSNSWGDEESITPYNRYTERTADVDRFCFEHPDFLVLFAAGNAGPFDDSVISPATGKNVVAVGATVHGDVEPPCPAWFSSRGLTQDSRLKPDLLAPGQDVISAAGDRQVDSSNCDVRSMSGTSMATPTAAGLAALVRQYYADGYYPSGEPTSSDGFVPSSALLKATLIASAVDVTTLGCAEAEPVPSRDQGWGLIQLDRALHFPGDSERLLVVDRRQAFTDTEQPPVGLRLELDQPGPLKVVLAWTDPPSYSAAEVNLVNDLDLAVGGPGGRFLGNVYSAGSSVTGGSPDRRNNVETVWLPEASSGEWTVTVTPAGLEVVPQGYALVIVGAVRGEEARTPSGRKG